MNKQLVTSTHQGLKHRLAQSRLGQLVAAAHRRGESGMAIVEYAIGILVVVAIVGVIIAFVRGGQGEKGVGSIFNGLIQVVIGIFN
ncbi:MAG: DUF4244 domain-containing protein [Propionibacteriaceae bacterium]|jgi:hypothetical protein|nr:DUF4244 domain-containing protein [Propionibacteriaceae bacterium]